MLSVVDLRTGATCPPDFNLAQHVLEENGAPDDKIALNILSLSGAERWSYGRLRSAVRGMSAGLKGAGLEPGDRLLMRVGHTPLFPIAFLASAWCGILPVPTSEALTSDEISAIAEAVDPSAVLFQKDIPLPRQSIPHIDVEKLSLDGAGAPPKTGDPNRPGYCLVTSGTSGAPRLVTHAHRAIWARHFMVVGWTALGPTDRILHAGALNWSYTLGTGLLDPWAQGATALVPQDGTPLEALPLLAKRHDATVLAGVPGVYRRLLRNPLPPLPRLRHALSAGEKLPDTIRTAWTDATGTDIHEAFGQTECSTFISGSPSRPAPPDTLGFAQLGRAIAIVENGAPVGRGQIGEIAVASDDPGLAIDHARHESEWVGTGDLGIMNDDGAIRYLGRDDDILTAGGFRVSPLDIEKAYETHAGIDAMAAVDHHIDVNTRVIAAYYTGAEALAPSDLGAYGKERLADHKVPRIFIHVDSLPYGNNGKLLRRALRTEKDTPS